MWLWRTIARSPEVSLRSAPADGDEVKGPLEVVGAQREVAGRDRGDEAAVKRLREVGRGVEAVPADPDRKLVGAELAGVEEAEDLDAREVRRKQLPVLADVVLAEVPGVL